MQIQVVGAPAPAFDLAALRTRLPLAHGACQDRPIVAERAYDTAFATATPVNTYVSIQDTTLTLTPPNGSGPVSIAVGVKTICDLFETEYGRRDTALGVVGPDIGEFAPTTIPLRYADAPTETLFAANLATPVGSGDDGTQIWKIVHRGANTRTVHFHLFNVQLVNRVGWHGSILPPEPNELGWKESIRINPLQDTIVAMRPRLPGLPFKVGDSMRLHSPAQVTGARHGFAQVNPQTGLPSVVTNQARNFGWEYAWHAHLAEPGTNDMARPIVLRASPAAPTSLAAVASGDQPRITLTWANHATIPAATNILIQRAADSTFAVGVTLFGVGATANSYADAMVTPGLSYHYRVRAETAVTYSAWSNPVYATVPLVAPADLTAAVSTSPPLVITLNWVNSVPATTITIQRGGDAEFTTGVRGWTVPVATVFADTTVVPASTYYYRIAAGVCAVSSAWSTVVAVTTPVAPPAPSELTLTATAPPTGTATATLSWSVSPVSQGKSVSVVEGFTIARATNSAFTTGLTTFAAPGAVRSFPNPGLARNTRYYYRVAAVNGAGTSAFSRPVSVLTPG